MRECLIGLPLAKAPHMRSTRKAPSMVEFDPRIQDEWITMEKEKSDTQVAKK